MMRPILKMQRFYNFTITVLGYFLPDTQTTNIKNILAPMKETSH